MKQYSKPYELKDKAKDTLRGNYGTLILGSFLFSLIICLVIFMFGFAFFLSAIASLYSGGGYSIAAYRMFQAGLWAGQVLSGFLGFGIAYLCLKLACGQPCSYTDIFYGFQRKNLFKVLLLTAVRLAFSFICTLPGEYFREKYLQSSHASLLLLTLLACMAGCCIYVPVALALDMTYFLLLDFPDKKAAGILRDSFHLIKGSRRRLFFLQLSFIPLWLLCLLSLGVGSLWLEPYMHMTYTLFYLDLINPRQI
ncbi:MAG: DUF975 family protein [Butyrivibrio sp.]|nr:DUF975 family protein [Acetatifactor muris]MCM1560313.1 DUF975 family protein [Butyrivibrio sp.]